MTDGEVKKFVDDIGFAIDAIRAKRTAAGKYGVDKVVLDEMDKQIVQLSAIKLEAQMELGDRSAGMEKNIIGRPKVVQGMDDFSEPKTKAAQLSDIGIQKQRAAEFEAMARNRPAVEQYIEESVSSGKAPTKSGALKIAKQQESYIKEDDTKPKKESPTAVRKKAAERDANIISAISGLIGGSETSYYGIDELVADIAANGENAVSTLKMFLSQWTALFETEENRKEVAKAIDDFYYRNIIRLKGEFNL